MYESLGFVVNSTIDENKKQKIEELDDMLRSVGMGIAYEEEDDFNFLKITYDKDAFKRATRRNAGTKLHCNNWNITVAEIRERMKEESAEEIAKSLNVSRSTLFRKLKAAEKIGEESLFWLP